MAVKLKLWGGDFCIRSLLMGPPEGDTQESCGLSLQIEQQQVSVPATRPEWVRARNRNMKYLLSLLLDTIKENH